MTSNTMMLACGRCEAVVVLFGGEARDDAAMRAIVMTRHKDLSRRLEASIWRRYSRN